MIYPISLLSGTIIGAGIFALPYAFAHAGWLIGIAYLCFFFVILALLHLLYADIALRSPTHHRLTGYVRSALGAFAGRVVAVGFLFGMFFTLVIYLTLVPSFFHLLSITADTEATLFFWLCASLVAVGGISVLVGAETIIVSAIVAIAGILFFVGSARGIPMFFHLPAVVPSAILFPFGSVLFAFAGGAAIPPIVEYIQDLRLSRRSLRSMVQRVIIIGTMIPAFVYLAFVFGIFGVSAQISPDAVSGILGYNPFVRDVIGALGLTAIFGAYIAISRNIFDTFRMDIKFPASLAAFFVFLFPLALLFSGKWSFFGLVSLGGGILVALEQMVVLLVWRATNSSGIFTLPLLRFPTLRIALFVLLFVIFGIGLLYQLVPLVRVGLQVAIQ